MGEGRGTISKGDNYKTKEERVNEKRSGEFQFGKKYPKRNDSV